MIESDYSTLAANVLRRKSLATRDSGFTRDEGVSLVAHAMERKARHIGFKRIWWAAITSAAALAVVVWLGIALHRSFTVPAPSVAAACSSESGCPGPPSTTSDLGITDGRTIGPGDRIFASTDRATRIELASGTRLALAAGSLLSYDEGSEAHRFSLMRGSVHLEVKKLQARQRFLVDTPDTQVEVRGTVFDVSWQGSPNHCGDQTSVSVTEGVVEVRHRGETVRVTAGQSWPTPCASARQPSLRPLRSEQRTQREAVVVPEAKPSVAWATTRESPGNQPASPSVEEAQAPATRASDLAEQNDLFARASDARRTGRSAQAIRLYDDLLLRFPRSPLAESAISSRLALLQSNDPKRAHVEARRYVESYPAGFSKSLAESILKEP